MDKNLGLGLQEDDEIGVGYPPLQKLKDFLVKNELIFVEVQKSEDSILIEEIVGDSHLVKEVHLGDLLLLLEAGDQEKDLSLKGIFPAVLIEGREERIFFRLFENAAGAELLPQEPREARFSYPDRAFDDNVLEHNSRKKFQVFEISYHKGRGFV